MTRDYFGKIDSSKDKVSNGYLVKWEKDLLGEESFLLLGKAVLLVLITLLLMLLLFSAFSKK